MFRTIGDGPSAWELLLPPEVLRLPGELARVDALLDDPVFFAPFAPFFHPVLGRPSTPVECYLRLMFLKFRYRLGYESLCAEVSDSICWRRFCRIPLDGKVPHPTTLMKLTTRCGSTAVDGLNEALLAKAAESKLLRASRLRADTTVIPANVSYPTDSGLLARAIRGSRRPGGGSRLPAGRRGPGCATAAGRRAGGRMRSPRSCGRGPRRPARRSKPWCPDDRGAGRPGRARRRGGAAAAGQRPPGAAPCRGEGGGPGRSRGAGCRCGPAAGPAAQRGR